MSVSLAQKEENLLKVLASETLSGKERFKLLADLDGVVTERSVPLLCAHLTHEHLPVRFVAMRRLGEIASPEAIDALGEVVRRDPGIAAGRAAELIAAEGYKDATTVLIYAAEERFRTIDADESVHRVIKALGRVRDRRSIPMLTAFLTDGTRRVRGSAARGLLRFQDPEMTSLVRQAAADTSWFRAGPLRSALRAFRQ